MKFRSTLIDFNFTSFYIRLNSHKTALRILILCLFVWQANNSLAQEVLRLNIGTEGNAPTIPSGWVNVWVDPLAGGIPSTVDVPNLNAAGWGIKTDNSGSNSWGLEDGTGIGGAASNGETTR